MQARVEDSWDKNISQSRVRARSRAARFNLGQQDHIGSVAAGKQADLVLIKNDPSKKIDEIKNVETVFKDGVGYDSQKLIASVRGQAGIRQDSAAISRRR